MTEKQTEALEKLNRGIRDSRQEAQQKTMSLAQDYFGDSAEELKQRIKESRATLEGLPDQVPGGREEAFQMMFQELMDNYTAMEQSINEAQGNVAGLDPDQIRRQGEVDATDAARRDARELGIDLTEIEGTGSDGRVTVDDVKNLADTMEDGAAGQAAGQAQAAAGQAAGQAQQAAGGAAQQAQDAAGQAAGQAQEVAGQATDQAGQVAGQAQDVLGQATGQVGQIADQGGGSNEKIDATDAARREAAERGIDLSKVEGTGADGRIIITDVTEIDDQAEGGADPAEQLKNQADGAAGQAKQAAQGAQDAAGQAAGQAQQAAGGATDQAGQVAGQATDQAGQVAGQAQEAAGQVTDQAGQAAQGVQDTVGGLTGGGGEEGGGPLGGVTDQVGQATQGVQDTAGQAAGQAQEAAGQATDQAGQVAGQAQEAAGGAAQQAQKTAGQAADQAKGAAGQATRQAPDAAEGDGDEGPKITNAARRKAEEMGVDLSKVKGTGSGGLITIKDVTGS